MRFNSAGLESYIQVEELEQRGIWLAFPGGRRFRVRRAGGSNEKYIRALQRALQPFRGRNLEAVDRAQSDEIMRRLYADHIVVDWEGIEDEDENPVPCTPENVNAFFEAFPELFSDLVRLASEASMFSQKQIEEAAAELGEG